MGGLLSSKTAIKSKASLKASSKAVLESKQNAGAGADFSLGCLSIHVPISISFLCALSLDIPLCVGESLVSYVAVVVDTFLTLAFVPKNNSGGSC